MESQEPSRVGAAARPPNSDEPGGRNYEEKLAKLQKYLPFLNDTIAKLESSKDKVRASQLGKMKNLQQLLTSQKQKMRIETLDRCEEVLKKLQEKLKAPITTDKVEVRNVVKTQPDEVMESPASPPQLDLNPPKIAPKIIPVERCATMERDHSHTEEGSSLEASRGRLKDLMLKTDLKTSTTASTSSPQIPGLDMMFPSQETVPYSHSSLDSLKSPTEPEKGNKNFLLPTPLREEWPRLDNVSQSKPGSRDWPAARDVDERRLNRDLDYRHSRIDIDHRNSLGNDRHGMQVHSVLSHPPLFPPSMNHLSQKPALLPRHMPTHNISYTSTSSVHEVARCADKVVLETKSSHQSISFSNASVVGTKTPLLPTPFETERGGNQPRHLSNQRDAAYDTPSNSPFMPAKSFSGSAPHLTERKSISSISSTSIAHSASQSDSMKTSARERIMQRLDQVEKLGVSSGGALRKLKADIEKGKRRPGETELSSNEEACQRSTDVPLRKIDPRLEKDSRRGSLDDEAQKYRNAPMGSLPLNMPNFSGHPASFGSPQQTSLQWNQTHATAPLGRTMYSGQSVMSTYWQSTCSVKQVSSVTTAHDLGMRYQPKSRHGKPTNVQYDRNIPCSISKPSEERLLGQREPEVLRRESELNQGKRPVDPRIAAMKPLEEKKHTDNRNADSNFKRKDKSKGKDESDFSSPLGSIYHEERRNKTCQGYGFQSYKIPKRPKEPSPPKDLVQCKNANESRITTRDPRLSKAIPLQPSPDIVKESSELYDQQSSIIPHENVSISTEEGDNSTQEKHGETTISSSKIQTKSPPTSPKINSGSDSITIGSPPDINSEDLNISNSNNQSLKPDKAAGKETMSPSRTQSPTNYRTSTRSGSRSRERSTSRSRGRSRSVRSSPKPKSGSPSRSRRRSRSSSRSRLRDRSSSYSRSRRSRSRVKSPALPRGRAKSRGRSTSKTRARSRERSSSRCRARSRGRSSSRGRSPSRSRANSRGRSTSRSRAKSRGRSTSRSRAKSRGRSTSRGRAKSRGRSTSRSRAKSRGRSTSRSRAKSRGRSTSRSRAKSRERSPSRSRAKSRGRSSSRTRAKSRGRSPSRTRAKSRGRSPSRTRAKSRGRSRDRSLSRSHYRPRSKERSSSRSNQRSPTYFSSKPNDEVLKARSRRSRSRSDSRSKASPSRSSAKSGFRDRLSLRGLSQSSDSDKNSLAGSWKRKESPSPERQEGRRKSHSGARRRSLSSDSNRSRDSSSVSSRTVSRSRSGGLSRNRSRARSRSPNQSRHKNESRRSLSRESTKDAKKSVSSSRSSSCSGRSSPLFPKGRSRSQSPHRELHFDKLVRKDETVFTNISTLSVKKETAIKTSIQEKDTVVSSSLNDNVCSSVDVMIDVPTSTSENTPEHFKGEAGSSSEANVENKNSKPSSSQQEGVGASVETGNIIVGLIKTLASQDLFKQTSLIELATLAASQLPEDKRNKVLEIFREGTGETLKEDPSKSVDSKADLEHLKKEVSQENESKGDSNLMNATSESETKSTPKKGKKKNQLAKVKIAKNSSLDALQKTDISPEGPEKQKKKRGKNELEKLHEDIREMFISKEVVTATGHRSCRMRKESKDVFQPPKSRPGSADEKGKFSRNKLHDNAIDFSDDSPSKDQTSSLDTTGSTSDCQTVVDIDKKIRSSSESEDDMPSSKCRRTSPDSSNLGFKKRCKINFIESDTESDSAMNVTESPRSLKEPLIVIEKSVNIQSGRRNVARRGRKIGSVSRDQVKMREEVYAPSYDGDCDEEEEESKMEDKDMSQIDTSNIIQIAGADRKLTRNQLKLLKGPENKYDFKLPTKRALNSSREFSECESGTSKSVELCTNLSFSPLKKKRKIKKPSNLQIGVEEERESVNPGPADSLISDESIDCSTFESVNEENCVNTAIGNDTIIHVPDSPTGKISDAKMHEAPLVSRIQNTPCLKNEVAIAEVSSPPGKPEHHEDLDYTVTVEKACCKICRFSGKMMVAHYLLCHPSEEVLISRLPKNLIEQAKANVCDYIEGDSTKFSARKRLSAPLKCLICKHVASNFMRLYEHVSIHTGEYRYSCNQCNFKAAQRISVKSHAKSRHPNIQVKDLCNVLQMEEGSTSKVLLAYLCSECNYFQLSKSNLIKHVQKYHIQNTSAQAIRVCVSEEVPFKPLGVGNKLKELGEEFSHVEVSGGFSLDCEPVASDNTGSDCQQGVSDNQAQDRILQDPLSSIPESEVIPKKTEAAKNMLPVVESLDMNNETDIFKSQPSSTSRKPVPAEMSIFIGTEHNMDDDKKLQEDRKKLLEDAGIKIRERPKIRSFISEKLAKRLHCDESSSPESPTTFVQEEITSRSSCNAPISSLDSVPLQIRTNLRTTPARLAQKSSESSDKRSLKTTPRSTSMLEPEILGPSQVPDEVKAPLPVSTLQSTLQRMQTTIESPVSTPPSSSLSSPSSITAQCQLKLKKGSVTVGPVAARAVDEAQNFSFFCLSPNCAFSTPQAIAFLKHIERHSEKPVSAPCSVCDEGGNILRDLRSSFNHLVKYHLVEGNNKEVAGTSSAVMSPTMTSNKPLLIRPRKMPGDILSLSENLPQDVESIGLPSLVIASVISLSKDHTPDGTPLEMQKNLVSSSINENGSRKFLSHLKKDPTCMAKMITFEKICHLFKCMGQHCSFSSNMKEIFTEHYQKHLLQELKHNSHAASEIFEWQKCAYCGDLKDSGEDLVDHILMQHSVLKYQCSGCFYRAATIACVIFHQTKSHCSNVMVFECSLPHIASDGQPSQLPSKFPKAGEIQAYVCGQFSDHGECGKVIVSSEDFASHQQMQHPSDNIFYCKECGLGLDSSSKLICHFSTSHSYRKYHCLHCSKASETREEISCHMFLDHPDRKMVVASRTSNEQMSPSSKTLKLASGAMVEVLDLDDFYSKYPSTLIISKNQETDNSNDPVLFNKSYSAPCHTYEISSKLSWAIESSLHPCASLPKSISQMGSEVGTANRDMNEDIQEIGSRFTKLMPSGQVVEENIKHKSDPLDVDESDNPSTNDSNKSATNLSGSSLYICGYSGCLFRGDTPSVLKGHMLICEFAQDAGTLSCVHCQKVFRNPSTLLEHLPKHGVPRYVCGLCDDFRTTHPAIVHRHVRNTHKLAAVEMVPLNPNNPDGVLVLRPKENIRKRVKVKNQQSGFNKTSFGPEEKNELPLSAVFTSDVICKVCNYATKVRSNMLRHLEQHEAGCEPSPVPVLNPVPCLERNEKMFDTMTNHAISSTIPVRRDSNAIKVLDEPKFVPENQRFVCCAPACHQISSDDAMLRHHIRVLHPEILVYKCPHCPEYENDSGKQPIMVEKLGSHLKMHDSRLYSCLSCSYYHYQRHIVERHTGEKHPDQKLIRIVREPQPDGPLDTENLVDTESEIIGTEGTYECALCSHRGSKTEVMGHVAVQHRIHAQYKCTLCNFRANVRVRFNSHFAKRHPNEKEAFIEVYRKCKIDKSNDEKSQPLPEISTTPVEPVVFDSTPLWTRNSPRVRHLRGILFEENSLKPREIEHTETRRADVFPSVRNKRPSNAMSSEDTTVNKRGKKDEATFTCAKCPSKFPIQHENSYRDHLLSHFNCDSLRYQCVRCLKSFPSTDEGIIHVTNTHQRLFTATDIVDTQSEDYISMDITRQLLEFGLPAEATLNKTSTPGKSSSPLQTSANRRLSPRGSLGGTTPTMSPAPVTPSTSPKKFDSVKGIKALGSRSVLKQVSYKAPQMEQPVNQGAELDCTPEIKTATNMQEDSWINIEDVDVEVDESALEEDIEEVEDEETSSEESQLQQTSNLGELNVDQNPSPVVEGFGCKYKDTCGCHFISKTKQEANYHEMMHWEIKPWKCSGCRYQAIKESSVRLHSSKVHPGLDFKPIKNDLPETPKILPLPSQRKKNILQKKVGLSGKKVSTLNEKLSDVKMAEIADVEEIFKSINVLRCCFCRLRETSLIRLFIHWQSSHKSNKTFSEKTSDGRSIVPFKFREVKAGDKGIETMAFKCGLCAKSGTIKLLLEHYPTRHPGEKLKISELIHDRVQCSMCPRQFSAKASLAHHFLSEHPGEQVVSSKVNSKDMSHNLQINMACFYCSEPVKSASEMKDHHLNFHSHLDAQYIELESNELPQQFATKRAVARKSTSRFRAVARKSTGGRKWHSMKTSPINVTDSSSNTSSDSDDDRYTSCDDELDENQISCSMMIEGIHMRVSLATLTKYSNIYPTIVLKKWAP